MSAIKAKQDWDDASDQSSPVRFRNKKGSLTSKASRESASCRLLTFKGSFGRNYPMTMLKKEASAASPCLQEC